LMREYLKYIKELKKRKPELVTDEELVFVINSIRVIRDELRIRLKILKDLAIGAMKDAMVVPASQGGMNREIKE
jgi:hypothetical protein